MDGAKVERRCDDMAPNTLKQRALRRVEKAVGATMPTDVYNPLSALPVRDIDALAQWLEDVAKGKHKKARTLPLEDFDA